MVMVVVDMEQGFVIWVDTGGATGLPLAATAPGGFL